MWQTCGIPLQALENHVSCCLSFSLAGPNLKRFPGKRQTEINRIKISQEGRKEAFPVWKTMLSLSNSNEIDSTKLHVNSRFVKLARVQVNFEKIQWTLDYISDFSSLGWHMVWASKNTAFIDFVVSFGGVTYIM